MTAFSSVWVLTIPDIAARPRLADELLAEEGAIIALADGERFLGLITRHHGICREALSTLRLQLRVGNLRQVECVWSPCLDPDRAAGAMREALGERWWLRPERCIHCDQPLHLKDELVCSRCLQHEADQASQRTPAVERAEARGYELGTRLVDQLADQLKREGLRGRELSVAISGAAEALDQRSDLLLENEDDDLT